MRDFETIVRVLTWAFILIVLAVTCWAIYHWDLFPRRRLRNKLFTELELGKIFYDFGGEDAQLREYIKTGEQEAQCLSVPDHPKVTFGKKDVVKIQVWWQ